MVKRVTMMHQISDRGDFSPLIPFNVRKNMIHNFILRGNKLDIDYGVHKKTALNKAKLYSRRKDVKVDGLNEDGKIVSSWIISKGVVKLLLVE